MKWIYLDMEVVNPRIPTIAAFVVILVMEAVSLAQAIWISAALYEGTPKGILCSAAPEPLQRSPIAHWRAGAGAAVYVGDTNIFYVDNHLSLILHNTNGTLQFMQRERRQSTKKMTRLHYNKLRLDRRISNACRIFTGKAFHKSRVGFRNARRNLSFYYYHHYSSWTFFVT